MMENFEYFNMVYGQRIKWIDQQLKSGKSLEDLLDARIKTYQQRVPRNLIIDIELPKCEAGMLSSEVNLAVMEKWDQFISGRPQNANTLLSMALWEFMSNHA